MDILKILSELRYERQQIEEAILSLQRLARGQGKRRGRPPKWMTDSQRIGDSNLTENPKRVFSAETRRKMALAQKRRWAAEGKSSKSSPGS